MTLSEVLRLAFWTEDHMLYMKIIKQTRLIRRGYGYITGKMLNWKLASLQFPGIDKISSMIQLRGTKCTSDIFEVNGKRESKKGREWGYERNEAFLKLAI